MSDINKTKQVESHRDSDRDNDETQMSPSDLMRSPTRTACERMMILRFVMENTLNITTVETIKEIFRKSFPNCVSLQMHYGTGHLFWCKRSQSYVITTLDRHLSPRSPKSSPKISRHRSISTAVFSFYGNRSCVVRLRSDVLDTSFSLPQPYVYQCERLLRPKHTYMLPKRPYSAHKTDPPRGYWTTWRFPKYTTAINFHILHPFTNTTFSDHKRCHQLYNRFPIFHTYGTFFSYLLVLHNSAVVNFPPTDPLISYVRFVNISPSFKQLLFSFLLSTLVSSPNILRDLHTICRTFHRAYTATSSLIPANHQGW